VWIQFDPDHNFDGFTPAAAVEVAQWLCDDCPKVAARLRRSHTADAIRHIPKPIASDIRDGELGLDLAELRRVANGHSGKYWRN